MTAKLLQEDFILLVLQGERGSRGELSQSAGKRKYLGKLFDRFHCALAETDQVNGFMAVRSSCNMDRLVMTSEDP